MTKIVYQPAAYQERQELNDWLKANAEHFADYTADEVAYRAILGGFSRGLVYDVIPHWFSDREHRCGYAMREWYHVDRELDYFNGLKEQWERLRRYEIGQE